MHLAEELTALLLDLTIVKKVSAMMEEITVNPDLTSGEGTLWLSLVQDLRQVLLTALGLLVAVVEVTFSTML